MNLTGQPIYKPGKRRKGRKLQPRASKPKRGPLKDPDYLEWITSLFCAACEVTVVARSAEVSYPYACQVSLMRQKSHSEAAHVGERGLGQKCSDRETIPLCAEHHRTGQDAHHVLGKRFWEHHGLDKAGIISRLNAEYENR